MLERADLHAHWCQYLFPCWSLIAQCALGVEGRPCDLAQAKTLQGNSATMWGPVGLEVGISPSMGNFPFFSGRLQFSNNSLLFLRLCASKTRATLQLAEICGQSLVLFLPWQASWLLRILILDQKSKVAWVRWPDMPQTFSDDSFEGLRSLPKARCSQSRIWHRTWTTKITSHVVTNFTLACGTQIQRSHHC